MPTLHVKGIDNKGISEGDFHIVAQPIEGEKDSANLSLDEWSRVSKFFFGRGGPTMICGGGIAGTDLYDGVVTRDRGGGGGKVGDGEGLGEGVGFVGVMLGQTLVWAIFFRSSEISENKKIIRKDN